MNWEIDREILDVEKEARSIAGPLIAVRDADMGHDVAFVHVHHEDLRPNAALIAAAPLLLEELKAIVDAKLFECNCHNGCEGTCVYSRAVAAIRAAGAAP